MPDVFGACIFLLAGFYPEVIDIDKSKKPKAWDWKACTKIMKNPEQLLEKLKGFKDVVDSNQVPASNVHSVKTMFLALEHFKPEVMESKSTAAKGVCSWVINIVLYWDVI